jgi:hypothetical protein
MTRQKQHENLELVLFENDLKSARRHIQCGIGSFLVDLELVGKDIRQLGFDTEINAGTMDDIRALSEISQARVWCRLNRFGTYTACEVEEAIVSGAAVLILPMATSLQEVRDFLSLIGSRCESCIMIETRESVRFAPELESMPIDSVFFGLNDYAICRGSRNIFEAIENGTVESVIRAMPTKRSGFGGLTHMSLGSPVPSAKLLEELCRLDCKFTFLRRSFRRDSQKIDPSQIVLGINNYWQACKSRSSDKTAEDHQEFIKLLGHIA